MVGVQARTPDGPLEVRAQLVIAADGRRSLLRDAAALPVEDLGAPMDVLWMRLSRKPSDDPEAPLGRASAGRLFVTIPREGYYQCGYVAAKGGFDAIKATGIEAFRRQVAQAAPALADRVDELASFDDVHLLTVTVDRLTRWSKPGLLCIGDAATPCRRWAGWGSIWRSRTRSPPPTSCMTPSRSTTLRWTSAPRPSSVAACRRPGPCSRCSC
ncbi:hypothetical protein DMC25_12680 [Caulobacter sp. D4A]|nr:hypothetical protein DMC25_12680 [Caulobacter sp. D4A]